MNQRATVKLEPYAADVEGGRAAVRDKPIVAVGKAETNRYWDR